ncbi:hypothetical protein KSP39_PZI009007 [Platanthera zijinensis]|uniref:Calmodulin-binding domain-containing protein n=1 Tax=Platanthera zijinensis TaxID=2320716 RepID=A0AAP0G832_9ASPA
MVQGKSPEQKRNHGGVDRPSSSDLHQHTSSRVGADLEKKLKKVRSMKISGFGSLQHSPTMDFQFKKMAVSPVRNYMKPTRSSDARKGNLRATVTSPAITDNNKKKNSSGTWKNSNSFMASSSSSSSSSAVLVKKCSKVSSCAKKNLNRATCSSTLKDSKFPAALLINPEGTSKMRVCPYTYCSLNGHMHELSSSSSPPPLKCFISERRRILRNQRSMDIEALFSVKTRDNEEERAGEERVKDIIEIPSVLFAGIYYRMPPEEIIGEKINCSEINNQEEKYQEQNCAFDESQFFYVLDQTSERSRDHLVDVMENLLEYVEVDDEGEAREVYEFEEENGDAKNSGMESIDMNCEAEHVSEKEEFETEHSSPETANILEHVEVDDEGKAQEDFEFEENGDAKNAGMESIDLNCEAEHVSEEEESETEHSSPETANILEYVEVDSEGKAQEEYEFDENGDARNTAGMEAMDMDCEAEDDSTKEEGSETEHSSPLPACLQPSSNLEAKNGTPETMPNASGIALKEAGEKWKIRRKVTTEESEEAKEFNPKQPNFLPLEPDPEDEKVDLRHQMMDGRRNAEEWMIDYALQHAVTRLGDRARKKKKKVALLVEAFETVVPMHTCETPVSHGTSPFTNLSFIQACS